MLGILRLVIKSLSPKGKALWLCAIVVGIFASALEVASAATFSLLTSALFGGRNSNLGILGNILPFAITETVLISSLALIFLSKLVFQWIELNLKTKPAEEFYTSMFQKKAFSGISEIETSIAPVSNSANRIHILTHNIYYPAGLIISELLVMIFLIPFVVYTSPRASFVILTSTLVLSFPVLKIARKKITTYNAIRTELDSVIDYESYFDYRSYYDEGRIRDSSGKVDKLIHSAAEIDRKIVKLGTYSRLVIELCFIVSVILTFTLLDELVPADARIQFFAVLAYSFFRVIPAFTRIVTARNQIASYQSEFIELATLVLPISIVKKSTHSTFTDSLSFTAVGTSARETIQDLSFSAGDFVLVRGETGSGKSTLLKIIAGLRTSGYVISIDGVEISKIDSWQPNVALVSQNPFLIGHSMMELVTGLPNLEGLDQELYSEALHMSCLATWDSSRIGQITHENVSGGERKQIALARAIYRKPEILLLDEVTAGMDQKLAEKIIENIISSSQFKLTIFTSHDSVLFKDFHHVIELK